MSKLTYSIRTQSTLLGNIANSLVEGNQIIENGFNTIVEKTASDRIEDNMMHANFLMEKLLDKFTELNTQMDNLVNALEHPKTE